MKRRDMLINTSAAVLGLSAFPLRLAAGQDGKRAKLLYFTKSVVYEHSVVKSGPDALSHSDKILIELGKKAGFDVTCSKDGQVLDGDLDQYDALVFYTCGDLSQPSIQKTPPVSAEGKRRLVDSVAAGKPFQIIFGAAGGIRRVQQGQRADILAHALQRQAQQPF